MSEAVRERQQFGNTSVTDGSQSFQGIAHGDVAMNLTHHHYAAPERPETPPKPTAVIPFDRDEDFVPRGTILDQVHYLGGKSASRTALVGLGGVGKSQIAIEYAYQIRERSPETWVFWVHASNAARYEQSFRDIADYVKLPERRNTRNNIFQLLYNWLCSEKSKKWVLILDNVDEASFLLDSPADHRNGQRKDSSGQSTRPLASYLPYCQHGSVLITTRSKHEALKLVESRNIVAVEPMSPTDAVALAQNKLKKLAKQEDIDSMEILAKTLEYMPLAIVQATAYILRKYPRCSVRQYLEKFKQSDRKKGNLLDYEDGQLRRDREASNSIIITWQLSFDHIRNTRPSASDLLSLMSFCDRQGIPESLLRASSKDPSIKSNQRQQSPDIDSRGNDDECTDEEIESESSADDKFEDDISALHDYSFISITGNGLTFEMHGLVQLATRRWLEAKGQQERWKNELISRLCVQLPTGHYENWGKTQVLLPHARSAAAQRPKVEASLREWASVLHKTAWYLRMVGQWHEAQKMAEDAMKVRMKSFGRGHKETLNSMTNLASTYWNQGRWEAAEKLFVEVMETRKQKLGADHPDTLTSMANLACTYWNQGRWEAAEKLEVEVMETRKQKLGADHPDTLTNMTNLACTYQNQGRWEAAEKLFVEVMETSKQKLGADHPSTLTSMANLACTYRNQGRWEAAEKLGVEVIETRKQKLGADHPSTLTSMANLACTYENQGRWEAAEKLEVEVMETRKQKLGADHPDTLTSMANLASTYWNQGRWEAAEKLDVEVMETRKQKLGADHPDTLTNMANLACTYWNQGRWEAAEKLGVEVMETRKQKLGADHPDTLTSMANLACTYKNQGRWEAAEKLEVEVIETRKQKLGADHPDTLTSMANLASTYKNQGRWEAAEKLFVEVMETRKQKLGADHPDTLTSMNNLAYTWKRQGRQLEALELMRKCVLATQRILGAHHPNYLSSLKTLDMWILEHTNVNASIHAFSSDIKKEA
ncbi:hypothetical protein F5Y19DRAFT_158981 [Xylariaceae sp. FL1651]|nr:hypothetical protein F5Y19DRAFT_158981 [Xylariaceae sp. FL1651]